MLDLADVADVCVRFRQNAHETFDAKYKRKVEVKDTLGQPNGFEAILRNFGSSIHDLEVLSRLHGINDFKTLEMINQHAVALKSLVLYEYNFTENMISVRPLFEKLHTLKLFDCEFENGGEKMLAACTELKVLRMQCNCVGIAFPKLEEVSFSNCKCKELSRVRSNGFLLEKFITLNPTLKRLKFDYESRKTLGLIIDHLRNLGQVKIGNIFRYRYAQKDEFEKCVQSLMSQGAQALSCSSLKMVTLPSDDFTVLLLNELARVEVPIECLSSNCIDIANAIEKNKLKYLKSWFFLFSDYSIKELVKEMPQLEELHLNCKASTRRISVIGIRKLIKNSKKLSYLRIEDAEKIQIEMEDYQIILKAIQNRPDKIPLSICLGNKKKPNVPTELVLANCEWLQFNNL